MNKIIKIATWNINSLRVRLESVLSWLKLYQPEVLALQETKLENHHFPHKQFEALGYHCLYNGQKTYNGVAFVSRIPMENTMDFFPGFTDPQRRILIVSIGALRIVNIYVPNGANLDSEKYSYKLQWLAQLKTYLKQELIKYPQLIVLGDFNIAPEDKDVHDPKAWENKVLFSPLERQIFKDIIDLGFKDSFRLFNKESGSYSWWDYRAAAFRRNHGLRIDHILSSNALVAQCIACEIDKEPRLGEKPSDHIPIIASYQNVS